MNRVQVHQVRMNQTHHLVVPYLSSGYTHTQNTHTHTDIGLKFLLFFSLCSSLISPLHSPSLSPGAVATVSTISPTTTYTVTSSATSNVTTPQMPHPETGHSPIVSRIVNMPSRLSVVQHISTDVIVDGSQPIIDQSSDGMTQLPTHETVSTDRPALTFPTTPTSNRTSHPRTGYRMMSPRDYVVPISPRKLHGMRTRQHFSEDFSYIIDAKEKGNIGRYINVCWHSMYTNDSRLSRSCIYNLSPFPPCLPPSISPSSLFTHSIAVLLTCLYRMYL